MINNIPFSYADAVKTSKLINVDLHIKFPPMNKIKTTLSTHRQVTQIQNATKKTKEAKRMKYQEREEIVQLNYNKEERKLNVEVSRVQRKCSTKLQQRRKKIEVSRMQRKCSTKLQQRRKKDKVSTK